MLSVNLESDHHAQMGPKGLTAITGGQCRAARGFLRWSIDELSARAGVARTTVLRFENETGRTITATSSVIRRAFEDAGVEFVGDYGVHFKPKAQADE